MKALPFQPDAFDAAWSIWVLEHVPNPEASLVEMRRVVKDGGLLFLLPAWNCTPYAADGYPVRPYADFGLAGKLTKASIPAWDYLWSASRVPVRLIRDFSRKVIGGPTQFRYRRLIPNYHQYWMPDSDAVNSLDRRETAMWFTSRGDHCLNCGDTQDGSLIIRIHKVSTAAN